MSQAHRQRFENLYEAAQGDEVVTLRPDELKGLFDEIDRLTQCLARANVQTEEYERRYYLALNQLERARAEAQRPAGLQSPGGARCSICESVLCSGCRGGI